MYYRDDILGMLSISQNNCLKINDLNCDGYRSHNFFKGLFEKCSTFSRDFLGKPTTFSRDFWCVYHLFWAMQMEA
jgi:hypothetical protein